MVDAVRVCASCDTYGCAAFLCRVVASVCPVMYRPAVCFFSVCAAHNGTATVTVAVAVTATVTVAVTVTATVTARPGAAHAALAQAYADLKMTDVATAQLESFLEVVTQTNHLAGKAEACSALGAIYTQQRRACTLFLSHTHPSSFPHASSLSFSLSFSLLSLFFSLFYWGR